MPDPVLTDVPKIDKNGDDFRKELEEKVLAMADFAYASGLSVPSDVASGLEECAQNGPAGLQTLNELYNKLAMLVAPAKPRGIVYLQKEKKKRGRMITDILGPVPTVRYMMLISILCLSFFIYASVSPHVNVKTMQSSLLELQGMEELVVSLFLLSAAAVGSAFANLYNAYGYLSRGTFDPEMISAYWVKFILGLIAGFILSELVVHFIDATATQGSFSRPLVSLLGGFSANTVYRILNRLIEAFGSLVEGSAQSQLDIRESELRAQFEKIDLNRKFTLMSRIVETKQKVAKQGVLDPVMEKELDALLQKSLND